MLHKQIQNTHYSIPASPIQKYSEPNTNYSKPNTSIPNTQYKNTQFPIPAYPIPNTQDQKLLRVLLIIKIEITFNIFGHHQLTEV